MLRSIPHSGPTWMHQSEPGKPSAMLRRRVCITEYQPKDAKAIAEMMVLISILFDMNTVYKTLL